MLNIDYTLYRPIRLWELDKRGRKVEPISNISKTNFSYSSKLTEEDNKKNNNESEGMMEMNNNTDFDKTYIISVREYEGENKPRKRDEISHLELYSNYQAPQFYRDLIDSYKKEEEIEEKVEAVKTLRKIR